MEGGVKMTPPLDISTLALTFGNFLYFQALNILSPMFCDTYCMGNFA